MALRKKSAILVGCGYYGTQYERYGCENDVRTIEEVLRTFGFRKENITTLIQTNTTDSPDHLPTRDNIQNALKNMRSEAGMGDVLFFYFSGFVDVDQCNNIPAILSSDRKPIPATEFRSHANQLPEKTSFTLVLESPHGTGFIHPVATGDKRILFSACQENETPLRVDPNNDRTRAYGAFTKAIQMALRDFPPRISNERLLGHVNTRMESFNQHAGLYCDPNNRNVDFLEYLTIN